MHCHLQGNIYNRKLKMLLHIVQKLQFFGITFLVMSKCIGKSVPLPAWSGPEVSRKLRFSDFMTTAQDDDKFVSLTHRPPLPPGNAPRTRFC